MSEIMRVCFFPDVVLSKKIEIGPKLKKAMLDADYNVINFEASYRGRYNKAKSKLGTKLYFEEEHIQILRQHNISTVCLANNHIMDYGKKGLADTIEILTNNDIQYFGAGKTKKDAEKPLVLHKDHIRVNVFGFSARNTNSTIATKCSPGVLHLSDTNIKKCINKYCNNTGHDKDYNVVFAHCGKEYIPYPEPFYQHLFTKLIKEDCSKIDLIVGCHAHTPQGYVTEKGKFCSFGMGNFAIPEGQYDGGSIIYHEEGVYGYGVQVDFLADHLVWNLVYYRISNSGKYVELIENTEKDEFEKKLKEISKSILKNEKEYYEWFREISPKRLFSLVNTHYDYIIRAAMELEVVSHHAYMEMYRLGGLLKRFLLGRKKR